MNLERKTLLISASIAFLLAIWGIAMAIFSGSDAIMLDGVFNLLSSIMALLGLRIASLTSEPYNRNYPIGYFAFEPLLVVVKGISILVLVMFAVSSNIQTLLAGGREPQIGLMLIYVIPAVSGCVLAWYFCNKAYLDKASNLLDAERQGWLLNAVISGAIGVALLLVLAIQGTSMDWVTRYVDQVLVIVFSLIFLREPFMLVKNGLKEVTLSAPDPALTTDAINALKTQAPHTEFEVTQAMMIKMGRRWWVTVEVKSLGEHMSVASFELYRAQLRAIADSYYDDHFTDVVLFESDGEQYSA